MYTPVLVSVETTKLLQSAAACSGFVTLFSLLGEVCLFRAEKYFIMLMIVMF